MLDDFNEKHPGNGVHYSTYYRIVHAMKISFVKLGEEECETCDAHQQHLIDHHGDDEKIIKKTRCSLLPKYDNCDMCQHFGTHIDTAMSAREHYREDAKKDIGANEIVMSVDLQKVMLLPRLPGLKRRFFVNGWWHSMSCLSRL